MRRKWHSKQVHGGQKIHIQCAIYALKAIHHKQQLQWFTPGLLNAAKKLWWLGRSSKNITRKVSSYKQCVSRKSTMFTLYITIWLNIIKKQVTSCQSKHCTWEIIQQVIADRLRSQPRVTKHVLMLCRTRMQYIGYTYRITDQNAPKTVWLLSSIQTHRRSLQYPRTPYLELGGAWHNTSVGCLYTSIQLLLAMPMLILPEMSFC